MPHSFSATMLQPKPSSLIPLSAIVLAGGQSSRMGQDKALVEIEGKPLLQRVCEIAQACTDSIYIVSPHNKRYQHLPIDQVQFIQEKPLPIDIMPHGPLVGFAQGLSLVKTEWVLLLACDLPNLQVEVLQQWIKELPELPSEVIAALPKNPQGWWEPLCGFYRRRCLTDLEAFMQTGGRSFQRWLSRQTVQELSLLDPQMLFNCNTPADLKQAGGGLRN